MSRRSQNRNQYETTTVGELAAGAFSVSVVSTLGLITDQDMYLVFEPDIPGQREWILIESITGNQLNIQNPNGRNLTGSDGDLTHPAGSKVRSVPTQQIFEDIFQDAEDDELALTQHQTDGGDPHAQAGYLKEADGDQLYVNLVGDTMTGLLILSADPATAFGAATKQSSENFATGLDHDHTTPIETHRLNTDAHHVAFVEGDADALYLPLDGNVAMAASLPMGGFKVTGLAAGTATGDSARFDELAALEARVTALEAGTQPAAHTHAAADTTTGAFADARIPNLNASKTTAGAFADARIPSLNASKTTAGVFTVARIPDINASKIIAGAFRSGAWTVAGGTLVLLNGTDLGVDGDFNLNGLMDLSAGIPIDAGANVLRLTTGFGVRRSS